MKRSIAYSIYDLAVVATLLLPFPIAISASAARSSKVLGYVMALVVVWILTSVTAGFARVSPAQYIRSFHQHP